MSDGQQVIPAVDEDELVEAEGQQAGGVWIGINPTNLCWPQRIN